jgi:Protein of unknown function (DUF1203)
MPFQITALPKSKFEHLYAMSSEELARHGALRQTVTKNPGAPCRVSLEDAAIGEEVVLLHYEHQSAESPFRASHAIYVRPGAEQANPLIGELPLLFRTRILSLRGFDTDGMIIQAELSEGNDLQSAIHNIFDDSKVEYIHIHFARPGCYAARVNRV